GRNQAEPVAVGLSLQADPARALQHLQQVHDTVERLPLGVPAVQLLKMPEQGAFALAGEGGGQAVENRLATFGKAVEAERGGGHGQPLHGEQGPLRTAGLLRTSRALCYGISVSSMALSRTAPLSALVASRA